MVYFKTNIQQRSYLFQITKRKSKLFLNNTGMILLGATIVLLFAQYMTSTSKMATIGYEVKGLEQEKAELERQQSLLRMQISTNGSLSAISNNPRVKSMEVVTKPVYQTQKTL